MASVCNDSVQVRRGRNVSGRLDLVYERIVMRVARFVVGKCPESQSIVTGVLQLEEPLSRNLSQMHSKRQGE